MCNEIDIAGTKFMSTEPGFAVGGQATLDEAVIKKGDLSRRFLVKYFYENGETDEALYESEALAQAAAANHHQAVLASVLYDRAARTSVMLKASSDCKTLQELLHEWEDIPPEDPGSKYYDMGRLLESIQIVKSLLGALDGIHNDETNPTLHMDLSPSNIMWGKNKAHGTVYLIDFNCSVRNDHRQEVGDHCRTTLSFSAPEIRIPGTILTPAADIYSVGAVFLLLVTGIIAANNPRSAKKWSVRELPGKCNDNVKNPIDKLEIPDEYKENLSEIIINATSPVEKRYQSASEMLEDIVALEKIIAGRGMTPETLIRGSAALFHKECNDKNGIFQYELQDDLLTETVDLEMHTPVDILNRNTILLGGGGSGKTTIIRKLWEQCLANWKKDRKNNPIPVYVPLNTFDSKRSNWDYFIRDYITEAYFPCLTMDVKQRREDLIGMFESTAKTVIFLDGIQEAVNSSMLNPEIAKLAAIKNLTVIITSRNDWGDDATKKLFSFAELTPLDDKLIFRKLQENGLGSPSARLLETLRKPMFLALFLKNKITDKAVETPGQILYEHHNYLIEAYKTGHHCDELECLKLVVQQILPKIASSINSMMCDSEQIYEVVKDIHFKSAKFRDIADSLGKNKLSRNATSILQNCGILRKINEDDEGIESFIFAHQNYLEFYQAYDVYEQMCAQKRGADLPNALAKSILPDAVMQFLGDLLGEHEFRTKANWNSEPSPVEEWMQLHCAGRKDHAVKMAVRNLVEVMKRSRERFITANYSNLDLSLANFYDCFLQNSLFTNATITDATFLRYGHRQPVDVIALLHSPERLVTGCWGEKEICIWDITTGQIVQRITHTDAIGRFEISSDEQLILVRTLGNVTIYKISDGKKVNEMELYSLNASMMQKGRHELVAFCADNRTILCSCGKNGEDQVRLWDVYTGDSKPVINLSEGYQKVPGVKTQCCTISADRKTLYAVSDQGELSVWSIEHHTCRKSFWVFSRVEGIVVTPDEKYAAMLTDDYALLVLDLTTGEIEKVCDSMENDSNGRIQERNIIIATNRYLIWAGKRMLGGYVFESGEIIRFHTPQISSMCVDEKGEQLIFSDEDRRIRIGNIQEKRIISSFDWGKYVNWSKPHPIIPHIYDNGIARITRNNHIQCLQTEKSFVIANNRNVCNCLDDNYHICLEANPEGDDRLVVRDLRSGTIVASVSDDLLCVAHNCSGEEIFGTRSDFRWAKYYESEQKLVVNYWAGLTKIWDVHTQQWKPAGDWAAEVSHILSYCSEAEWDTMRDELIKTSKRCFPIGAYVVCGTHNGHVQFWNLSGSKVADIVAHNSSVERMYAVPGGKYFVSQGIDESRCIWNVETFEKICWDVHTSLINEENIIGAMTVNEAIEHGINLHSNPFIEPQSADGELIVYYEVAESIVLLACSEKEQIPSKRIVSDSGEIIAYFDDPDVFEKPYNSYIRVYNARTQKLLHNYDLFLSKSEALDDNYVEFTNYAVNISLHERSGKLAVAFADGTVLLFDLTQRTAEAHFAWGVIGAEDVSGCDFRDVYANQELMRLLIENGAQF